MEKKVIGYSFCDGSVREYEVDDALYSVHKQIDNAKRNSDRRETRRHQSLDKSLEHGWDVADSSANIELEIERKETKIEIHNALKQLTAKQRAVIILHAVHGRSFREISKKMNVNKDTVREHYQAAINKMRNLLK